MAQDAQGRVARMLAGLQPEVAVPAREGPLQKLSQRMAHYATPGASIAVVEDFKVAWARGFGVRTMGTTDPVTATTPFQSASISKPVFALAVMRLVEGGTLDLDTDVNRYLTSWQVPANGGWQPRVTPRPLLRPNPRTTLPGFSGSPANAPSAPPLPVL